MPGVVPATSSRQRLTMACGSGRAARRPFGVPRPLTATASSSTTPRAARTASIDPVELRKCRPAPCPSATAATPPAGRPPGLGAVLVGQVARLVRAPRAVPIMTRQVPGVFARMSRRPGAWPPEAAAVPSTGPRRQPRVSHISRGCWRYRRHISAAMVAREHVQELGKRIGRFRSDKLLTNSSPNESALRLYPQPPRPACAPDTGALRAGPPPQPHHQALSAQPTPGGPGGRPPGRNARRPGAADAAHRACRLRVGEEGFEPSHPFGHTDLNRARLPFRHSPRAGRLRLARPPACSDPG